MALTPEERAAFLDPFGTATEPAAVAEDVPRCESCGTTEREVQYSAELGVTKCGECFSRRADMLLRGSTAIAPGELAPDALYEQSANGHAASEEDRPFALSAREFVADKHEAPTPLIGTEDDCILPEYGLGLLIAKGGKGKTTFTLDLILHLASGEDYLGLAIERPLRLLFIENEGPQEPFRRKLERKLASWPHEIQGHVAVHTENWGHARLDLEECVERLNAYCDEYEIDLVVGDPLDSLGMDGEGSPSETRAMVDRFKAAGLFTKRAWFLPHHSRKESVDDAVDEASGAWGGRPDTMLALEKRPDDQARLSFSKVRWQSRERNPYLLDFDPRTESFSFVKEQEGEERDYALETETYLIEHPHMTVEEIADGIAASKSKVRETLEAHRPHRFEVRTGEEAKAVGRSPNSKAWSVAESVDSPPSPDNPDTFSQGVLS